MKICDFTVPELDKFRELCNFVLYSSTDTPEERRELQSTLVNLYNIYGK